MNDNLYRLCEQRVSRLFNDGHSGLLKGSLIGLEKESLRVSKDGGIAQTPHPPILGSALTHPYITTDYSEALVEFITPPLANPRQALQFLCHTQKFVYDRLDQELLWATSMPCVLAGESGIPIARYGSSNAGMMKTVYRRGLGYRYGRIMQVIAGVHFNYSLPEAFWRAYQVMVKDHRELSDFISAAYFHMIRNMQRYGWLITYLFGASPAVCKSFFEGQTTTMQEFNANTYYQPYATSLRMADIGYQNSQEQGAGIKVCYDSLEAYVASLTHAIETPFPQYRKIGVVVDGEYRQLNANILQIENEYYSTIRPKLVVGPEEKPTMALMRRGVQYIELRSLDVNAFDPLGINQHQLYFLEALLLFSLFHESPPITARERDSIDFNQNITAYCGRDPDLCLRRYESVQSNDSVQPDDPVQLDDPAGRTQLLKEWAMEICTAMQGVCELLDRAAVPDHPAASEHPGEDQPYTRALQWQKEAILDPERTPSARMLAEMRAHQEGFFHFAMRMSQEHSHYFDNLWLGDEHINLFTEAARDSIHRQREIEAADNISFPEYLQRYFAQTT